MIIINRNGLTDSTEAEGYAALCQKLRRTG